MIVIEVVGGVVVAAVLTGFGFSVRIIREYQRVVLFRLGRSLGIKGPGLVFINPITDRTSLVNLRERFLEIPRQTAITQDNASISIDFIIFYKVVDPAMSVLEVQNFAAAAQNVAATTLRSVVGDMMLDDVLSKREEMNASLRVRLDDVTERWGVRVTTVEVREVNPPAGVLEAMTRQMSAERTRRAVITEAQGQKEAAVTLAEGNRQAAILGVCHPAGRRPGGGTGEDLRRRRRPRPEHHAAPVPPDVEGRGCRAIHQNRCAHGIGRADRGAAGSPPTGAIRRSDGERRRVVPCE